MAVGVQATPDGSTPATGRQCRTGEQAIQQVHGSRYEAASRGTLFCANTGTGGVTVQVSNTTTGMISLTNPAASKTLVSLEIVSITYVSGTLPAGNFWHGVNGVGVTAPSSGTPNTPVCTGVGTGSGGSPVATVRTGATIVASTLLWPFASTFVELATTANPIQPGDFAVRGAIVLYPGTSYNVVCVAGAAGSSPVAAFGLVWEEIAMVQGQG